MRRRSRAARDDVRTNVRDAMRAAMRACSLARIARIRGRNAKFHRGTPVRRVAMRRASRRARDVARNEGATRHRCSSEPPSRRAMLPRASAEAPRRRPRGWEKIFSRRPSRDPRGGVARASGRRSTHLARVVASDAPLVLDAASRSPVIAIVRRTRLASATRMQVARRRLRRVMRPARGSVDGVGGNLRALSRRRGRDRRDLRVAAGAEGATAPETLRQKDRGVRAIHLESRRAAPRPPKGSRSQAQATDGAPHRAGLGPGSVCARRLPPRTLLGSP